MRCFPDTPFFMTDTKIKVHISFESSEKKKPLLFSKICYVVCVISHAGQLIYLHASLDECNHMGLSDRPALKSKVK